MAAAGVIASATMNARTVYHKSSVNSMRIAPTMRAQSLSSSSSAFVAASSSSQVLNLTSAQRPQGRRGLVVYAGNAGTGGPFAPLVRVVRDAMGKKEFNTFRGKAISLHSQIIKDFCRQIGVDTKQVQGLIRLAKKNGEKLGFLA